MVDVKQIKVLAWDIGGTVFNWRGTIQKELEAIARHQEKELDVFRLQVSGDTACSTCLLKFGAEKYLG